MKVTNAAEREFLATRTRELKGLLEQFETVAKKTGAKLNSSDLRSLNERIEEWERVLLAYDHVEQVLREGLPDISSLPDFLGDLLVTRDMYSSSNWRGAFHHGEIDFGGLKKLLKDLGFSVKLTLSITDAFQEPIVIHDASANSHAQDQQPAQRVDEAG